MLSFAGYSEGGAMNGEVPSVPITTLAGLASLTHCKYSLKLSRYTDGALSDWAHELSLSWVYSDYPIFFSVFLADILQTILEIWVKLIKSKAEYENLALGRLKNNKMPQKHINHPNFTMYVSLKRLQLNKNIDYAQSVSLGLRYYSDKMSWLRWDIYYA